jgi:hypothetical protein
MSLAVGSIIHREPPNGKPGDGSMSTTDIARQLEAEDLARAKELTESILQNWDWITWNELLADDVVLSLRMASVGINSIGDLDVAGGNLQVAGREDAKRVLKSIYVDIKRGFCVTTEILSGYDVALFGNMAFGLPAKSWPLVIYMGFNDDGKIRAMTIATADLQPLIDSIRSAAQTGTLKAV